DLVTGVQTCALPICVEVEVVLLDVLPVIAFGPGESEQPLLEDGVSLVPQRQAEAQALMVVRDAEKTVLTPPIRPRARVIVREVLPGVPSGRVILAHRAPLTVGEIGAPAPP